MWRIKYWIGLCVFITISIITSVKLHMHTLKYIVANLHFMCPYWIMTYGIWWRYNNQCSSNITRYIFLLYIWYYFATAVAPNKLQSNVIKHLFVVNKLAQSCGWINFDNLHGLCSIIYLMPVYIFWLFHMLRVGLLMDHAMLLLNLHRYIKSKTTENKACSH